MSRRIALHALQHVPCISTYRGLVASTVRSKLASCGSQATIVRVAGAQRTFSSAWSSGQEPNRHGWVYAATLLAAGGCLSGLAWGSQPAEARQVPQGGGANRGQDKHSSAAAQQEPPMYTPEDVAKHRTLESRIWVTYKDGVYDITEFVAQHPGGAQKIMLAGESQLTTKHSQCLLSQLCRLV
jgi:cytochrome b involved in lipid metabolism